MRATIEFLNELVDRFAVATKANRTTPGRRGSVIELGPSDADEVLVVGDLHGNRMNFNKVLKFADLDDHPKRHLVLQEVVHGGPAYEDGGDMSHMLLEDVAKLKVMYPARVHFLLSNHELSEVTKVSLHKGGLSQNHLFAVGIETAYGPAAGRITECYHEFIRSCPLAIRLKNGVFISHTLPDKRAAKHFDAKVLTRELTEEDMLIGGSAYAMVWGREHDNDFVAKFAKLFKSTVLVNGHEPTPQGFQCPNDYQIILDASGPECCCVILPTDRPVTLDDVKGAMKTL